jgi:hypothetical protein
MKRLAVAPLSDGRLELWARTDQGQLLTTWKTVVNPDATWTAWSDFLAEVGPLASTATALAVAPLGDGRLQFWVSTDQGQLLTTWKTTIDPDAPWVGWSDFLTEVGPLAGTVTDIAVAPLSDGRVELWVSTEQGQLLTAWKTAVDPDASWSLWSDALAESGPLPGIATAVAVAPLSDGRLELWVSTEQGQLLTAWKTTVNPDAPWTLWSDALAESGPLPGTVTDIGVAPLPDGRLELWVSTNQGQLSTTWKTAVDPDAAWTSWSDFLAEVGPLPSTVTDVAVAPLSDGRLELWARTDQGRLLTTWKTTTNPDATWAGWSDFVTGEIDPPGLVITEPLQPPVEGCGEATAATGFFDAPSGLIACSDPNCGRLIPNLRRLAKAKNAKDALVDAAFVHYMLRRPEVGNRYPLSPSLLFAQAATDLAVTGREAYGHFRLLALREADLIEPVRERIITDFPEHEPVPLDVSAAVQETLQRAYKVAWALRGPAQHRKTERLGLGWIAVEGEDDPPHRPVNVPSALYPQYDLTVEVNAIPVETRFIVYSRHVTEDPSVDLAAVPPDRGFPLIVGDVILFIHGHSSSSEEALPLIGPLLARAADHKRPVTLIAMDLPSNGYSSMIDHATAAPTESLWNVGYPLLDFIENFIVAFVDQLEAKQPGIQKQIIGVIGGSLGGNMTLRLGRRDLAAFPWLHSVVSWSPASTWLSWARAVIGPALKGRFYDFIKHGGVDKTRGAMVETESDGSLHVFFYEELLGRNIGRIGQSDEWYSPAWPCAEAAKTGSHRSLYEIYNATFRQWHWRVAHEQLIFSHWDSDNPDLAVDPDPRNDATAGPARYSQIQSRVLLAAGEHDDRHPANIYSWTALLARAMTMVRGTTLFLKETGHSIPTERPVLFADHLLQFLFVTPPTPAGVLWITDIDFNPPGRDVDSEYVAIRNDTPGPIDMSNWSLRDVAAHVFKFPAFVLQPGLSVKVWTRAGTNDAENLFWGRRAAVWNNTGDTAILRNENGVEMARYAY